MPADTPILFGSFEPIPLEFWAKVKVAFGPVADAVAAQKRAAGEPEGDPVYLSHPAPRRRR